MPLFTGRRPKGRVVSVRLLKPVVGGRFSVRSTDVFQYLRSKTMCVPYCLLYRHCYVIFIFCFRLHNKYVYTLQLSIERKYTCTHKGRDGIQ